MTKKELFTFEEILRQNENRIHYQLHRLGIHDPEGEFYAEGLFTMWRAYKQYEPNKGPLPTYFNYQIRNRLIDLIRSRAKEEEQKQSVVDQYSSSHSNPRSITESPFVTFSDEAIFDEQLWHKVFATLTEKQRKWVYYAIIKNDTAPEIAEQEGVSVEAVKSWAKEAKKKLRKVWKSREEFLEEIGVGE